MATCTVEVGLLSKKPCGQPSVTQCLNCEMTLCSKHAVPEMAGTRKTGKFLCKECYAAHKVHDQITPSAPPSAPAKPASAPAPKAAAAPAKPAAVAKAAAPKEPPKKEEKKPDDDAPLEFTPSKK